MVGRRGRLGPGGGSYEDPFGGIPAPNIPLSNPLWTPPGPPVAPGNPTPTSQEFSSSILLPNGQPQVLCNLNYDKPTPTTSFFAAPIANNFEYASTGFLGTRADGVTQSTLWVLGEALLGVGGTSFKFNFEIPLEGVAQLSCVCESLKVTGRLYEILVPTAGAFDPDQVINPPIFDGLAGFQVKGVPPFNPVPVYVQGVGGRGPSGLSNLTRRVIVRGTDMAGISGGCLVPCPSLATMVRIIGDPRIQTTDIGNIQYTGGLVTLDAGPMSIDREDRPITVLALSSGTASGAGIFVQPNGSPVVDPAACEVIFRLGLAGFIS
jgi:hypothetical protein